MALSYLNSILISDELNAALNATQAGISFKSLDIIQKSYKISKENQEINKKMLELMNKDSSQNILQNILETQQQILLELKKIIQVPKKYYLEKLWIL